jgi:hypothetical protein
VPDTHPGADILERSSLSKYSEILIPGEDILERNSEIQRYNNIQGRYRIGTEMNQCELSTVLYPE